MFNEFEFQIDNFMVYCDSKNLSKKTKASYEQTSHFTSEMNLKSMILAMLKWPTSASI